MITADTLQFYFQDLTRAQIQTIANQEGDYIYMRLSVYNAGATATAERMHYSEEAEAEASANGQIFADIDDFLRLYKESGAKNPSIEAYFM